jgi:hypothetical protein
LEVFKANFAKFTSEIIEFFLCTYKKKVSNLPDFTGVLKLTSYWIKGFLKPIGLYHKRVFKAASSQHKWVSERHRKLYTCKLHQQHSLTAFKTAFEWHQLLSKIFYNS